MSWSDDNAELIEGFLAESRDALDSINPLFVEVVDSLNDGAAVNTETLNGIFRLFHTMKGSAGFLNLNVLVEVNHEAETLLDIGRNNPQILKSSDVETMLKSCDVLSQLLDCIELTGTDEGNIDTSEILEELKACQANMGSAPAAAGTSAPEANITSGNELTGDEFTLDFDLLSPEILEKFVQEGLDLLDSAESDLLSLSKNKADPSVLSGAFRNVHTFKGNCGFMSFSDMQKVSHGVEAVLEGLMSGSISPEEEKLNVLLNTTDTLRESLIGLMQGSKGEIAEKETIITLLENMKPLETATKAKTTKNDETIEFNTKLASQILLIEDDKTSQKLISKILIKKGFECHVFEKAEEGLELLNSGTKIDVCLTDITLPGMSGQEFISQMNARYHAIPIIALSGNKDRELLKDLMKLEVYGFADKPIVREELLKLVENAIEHYVRKQFQSGKTTETEKSPAKLSTKQNIRVDLQKLDTLIDLVGELIIAEAMAVRMVPVSATFKKMMRLVHDVSNKIGKPLKLVIRGEETEVDKAVVDMIADPLVHMIRNSADHGVEPPEEREKAGKNKQGIITLEAKQRASEVLIIVKDDGRGLNREKIIEKSKANGLITDNGESLSDDEAYHLIFEPGFSTAAEVTDISGRGVGMDVVKKNIEKIKGRIEIKNTPGEGCAFIIHIPLTLATIEGMLVTVGKTKYTVPIVDIRESFRPSREQITIRPDGQEVVRIREHLLPVYRLHELHNITSDSEELTDGILMVLDLLNGPVCLFVDTILHQVQTVIKHLSGYMGDVRGISGCNILGNGEVALILDPESAMKCIPTRRKIHKVV